jgi:hypothetical protein
MKREKIKKVSQEQVSHVSSWARTCQDDVKRKLKNQQMPFLSPWNIYTTVFLFKSFTKALAVDQSRAFLFEYK